MIASTSPIPGVTCSGGVSQRALAIISQDHGWLGNMLIALRRPREDQNE